MKRRSNVNHISDDSESSEESTSKTLVHDSSSEQASSQENSLPCSSQQSYSDQSVSFEFANDSRRRLTPVTSAKKKPGQNLRFKAHAGSVQKEKNKKVDVPKKGYNRGRRVSEYEKSKNWEEEANIYYLIKNNESSLDDIVDDWIDKYKISNKNAFLMLMQFLFDVSGCKGRITLEMLTSMNHSEIIGRMSKEEFEEQGEKYPLTFIEKKWKWLYVNFCDFMQILVHQCHQSSIIFDKFLLENLIDFLRHLSISPVKSFRHTSTLAAMKLMSALLEVYEYSKSSHKENEKEIHNMLSMIFRSIFLQRYKDISPDIRAICIEEIGLWMKKYPQTYLENQYLVHIEIMLHDKVGEVRLKCLQALQPLYSSNVLNEKLKNFTVRLKKRIVNMTHDVFKDAGVEAVKLIIKILKNQPEVFEENDFEMIYELLFATHQALARIAGEMMTKKCFTSVTEMENTSLIHDLAIFFSEAEVPGCGDLLVDSLIDQNEIMKDWKCMTDLLLQTVGHQEKTLDNHQENSLIELMVCCIKQTATGEPPNIRGHTTKLSAKEIEKIDEEKQRLTSHFIVTLPLLLEKYCKNPEKLLHLLVIPQYFDLDVYTEAKEEENLDLLFMKIQRIVEIIYDPDVLNIAARTVEYLCTEKTTIFTRCDIKRSLLIDSIVRNYKRTIRECRAAITNDEINKDYFFNVTQALKKITVFYSTHDMNSYELWDLLYGNIVDAFSVTEDSEEPFPEETVKYCITACYFSILWCQRNFMNVKKSEQLNEEECSRLKEQMNNYMGFMCNIILGENIRSSVPVVLREDAYIVFCDLLIIFCNQLYSHPNPVMHQLVYKPTESMANMLNEFLQEFVFIQNQNEQLSQYSRIEELNKRRNFLGSYCKLITYNIMPMKVASNVFKNYLKYYRDYGNLLKETLKRARDINRINCALTMQYSLNILYNEIISKKGKINRNSKEFTAIKDLAKQFASLLGRDDVNNQEAIAALHRAGILFVIPTLNDETVNFTKPRNLSFLEVLSEFSNSLMQKDKQVMLKFLDDRLQQAGFKYSQSEIWHPLILYRNNLLQVKKNSNIERINKSRKTKTPRKNELSISKIPFDCQSTSFGASTFNSKNLVEIEGEVSPMPSIHDSSSRSSDLNLDTSSQFENSKSKSRMEAS